MRLLFVGNQGGDAVVGVNAAIAAECKTREIDAAVVFAVWYNSEGQLTQARVPSAEAIHVYEEFLSANASDWGAHLDRINKEYSDANWSAVLASERSFVDPSFLLGAGGNRRETQVYSERILVNVVRFLEKVLEASRIDAIVCHTADSLFTHILYKVAARYRVRILAITPIWLAEGGVPGFALASDEYRRCPEMIAAYEDLRLRDLSVAEVERAEQLRRAILGFDLSKAVKKTVRRRYLVGPLSPNIRRLPWYLVKNFKRNKELDYQRFDPFVKAKANLLRAWRRWRTGPLLGGNMPPTAERYVLLALHFQPEQSTLVGGIFYANQIALAEDIAKSLPLGWTLVVKEHPKGRGSRPAWQYRHLTSFPNVVMSDAPTKALLENASAVVTVTGTIAVEAMAMDRAAIILGRSYFDYADILYRPESVQRLAAVFRKILLERDYELRTDRQDLIRKFMLSFALGSKPGFPSLPATAPAISEAILNDLSTEGHPKPNQGGNPAAREEP